MVEEKVWVSLWGYTKSAPATIGLQNIGATVAEVAPPILLIDLRLLTILYLLVGLLGKMVKVA